MRVLAVAGEKGGSGKTSLAVGLAGALAEQAPVLLVDLDPAGAASAWLGARGDGLELLAALERRDLARVAAETTTAGLWLAPGGRAMLGYQPGRELALRAALRVLRGPWRWCLVDTAPGVSPLLAEALAVAELVLVPVETTALGLEGPAQLARTVERVRADDNPDLAVRYVLSKVDRRTRLSGEVAAHVRRTYGAAVARTELRVSSKTAEAPSHGRPVTAYAPSSRGAEDLRALARELERWR